MIIRAVLQALRGLKPLPLLPQRGCDIPVLGPIANTGPFLGTWVKIAPSRKAVLFDEWILAEAEPELIWTDQR